MVKANAYGVGLETIDYIDSLVDYYGVACFFEAKNLINRTNKPILITGAIDDEIDERFSYTCSSVDDVKILMKLNKNIKIHIKVNTGMNRYGVESITKFIKMLDLIENSKLTLEGVYTHFATSDEYVDIQYGKFNKYIQIVKDKGFNPIIHTDNSVVNKKKNHHQDMVRIGFDLFAYNVLSVKSRVVQINKVKKNDLVGYDKRFVAMKNLRVGIIPIGYADGFDMRLIGKCLIIKGISCKILNICMDCFMIDISNVNIKKGDDIFIIDDIHSIFSYAKYLDISPYQVLTNFSFMRADKLITSANREYK